MKVFILSNDDLTSNIIFSHLLNNPRVEILGVAFSKTLTSKKTSLLTGAIDLLKKMDFYYWIYLVFINFCYKMSEFIFSFFYPFLKNVPTLHISVLCRKNNIPFYRTNNVNSKEFCSMLRDLKPDLFAIRINQILGEEILSIPKYGTWCVHSSILPSYKGIAAEFHGLRNQEPCIGSTIFEVTSELDKGPSLYQIEFNTSPSKSVFHHMIKNNIFAGKILSEAITLKIENKFFANLAKIKKQSYYSWPLRGQVKELKLKGVNLISPYETLKLLFFSVSGRINLNKFAKN